MKTQSGNDTAAENLQLDSKANAVVIKASGNIDSALKGSGIYSAT
jgi:hypothetical protein